MAKDGKVVYWSASRAAHHLRMVVSHEIQWEIAGMIFHWRRHISELKVNGGALFKIRPQTHFDHGLVAVLFNGPDLVLRASPALFAFREEAYSLFLVSNPHHWIESKRHYAWLYGAGSLGAPG